MKNRKIRSVLAMLAIGMTGVVAGCDKGATSKTQTNTESPKTETSTSESSTSEIRSKPIKVTTTASDYATAIDARLAAGKGVGVAMSIVDHNSEDLILRGLANQITNEKISQETLFEIGSITKTFTGIVLADMVLKGEVKLDDPVSKFLPDNVTMPSYKGQAITLEDLATHRSSLPRMPSNFAPAIPSNPFADYTPHLMYAFLSSHKLSRPIGEKVDYSNLGLGLLGHVLELKTSLSYEALVKERILDPLGMKNTFMVIPERKKSVFAIGHDVARNPTSHWDINTLSGAGALRSDIQDMTIYLKANMGLISSDLDAAIKLSQKLHQDMPGPDEYVGLAWFTQNFGDQKVTWHNGGTGGFRTFLGFDYDNKRGVVVLANAQDDPDGMGNAVLTQDPESMLPEEENIDIVFTEAELEKFVGDYQLAPTFIISITRKDKNLFAQATGQGMNPIFPKSDLEFFFKVVDASLIFNKNDAGEIVSLILNQGGMMQPAPKL